MHKSSCFKFRPQLSVFIKTLRSNKAFLGFELIGRLWLAWLLTAWLLFELPFLPGCLAVQMCGYRGSTPILDGKEQGS